MKSPDQSASTPDTRAQAPNQQQHQQGSGAAQNQHSSSAESRAGQTDQSAGANPTSGMNQHTTPEHAAGAFKQTPIGRSQAPRAEGGPEATPSMPGWQSAVTAVRDTARSAWASLPTSVRKPSATTLALGAAAVGAAVWLGTRKGKASGSGSYSQKPNDRWSDMTKKKAKSGSTVGSRYGESGLDL